MAEHCDLGYSCQEELLASFSLFTTQFLVKTNVKKNISSLEKLT